MFDKSSHGQDDSSRETRSEGESLLRLTDVTARARGTGTPLGAIVEGTGSDDGESGTGAEAGDDYRAGTRRAGDEVLQGRGGLVRQWIPAAVAGAVTKHAHRRFGVLVVGTGVVVALLTGGYLLFNGPSEQRASAEPKLPTADMSGSAATTTATSATSDSLVVSIVGHVAEPGLVTLSADARVADALEAAGGVDDSSDRRSVNLARHIDDGEQLYVGVSAPATASRQSNAGNAGAEQSGTVNLNTADLAALQELPHVGEVTAQRIIDWRQEHDQFQDADQLRQVNGIGSKKFAELRDLVRVE